MSRWLWALLAGVVLVAIAAVFWIDQTSVPPQVSRGTTPVAPAPSPASTAQSAAPSAPSSPSPPAAPEAAAPPAPAAAPDSARQAASPPAPTAPPPEKPAAPPVVAEQPSPPPAPPPTRRSAAAAARARTGGVAGSRRPIRSKEPCPAGRDLGLFRRGLRAALPAPRRRLGLSGAGGQIRPGGDCRVAEEDPSAFRHLPD